MISEANLDQFNKISLKNLGYLFYHFQKNYEGNIKTSL